MYCMVVTLEVSRLNGWLNDDASCRVEREASEERCHGGGEMGGRGVAAAAQAARTAEPTVGAAVRARAERTKNMYCMVVTLEVSRLSD
eukprot:scaffold36956_cov62-Phaeocystis_antarctica.AAC.2